jgi:hypothetical protein
MLKRGMMSTIEELLLAAEYILSSGNTGVVLCERGIRSFEKATRYTLDISAVPVIKKTERASRDRRSQPRNRPPRLRRLRGARRGRGRRIAPAGSR